MSIVPDFSTKRLRTSPEAMDLAIRAEPTAAAPFPPVAHAPPYPNFLNLPRARSIQIILLAVSPIDRLGCRDHYVLRRVCKTWNQLFNQTDFLQSTLDYVKDGRLVPENALRRISQAVGVSLDSLRTWLRQQRNFFLFHKSRPIPLVIAYKIFFSAASPIDQAGCEQHYKLRRVCKSWNRLFDHSEFLLETLSYVGDGSSVPATALRRIFQATVDYPVSHAVQLTRESILSNGFSGVLQRFFKPIDMQCLTENRCWADKCFKRWIHVLSEVERNLIRKLNLRIGVIAKTKRHNTWLSHDPWLSPEYYERILSILAKNSSSPIRDLTIPDGLPQREPEEPDLAASNHLRNGFIANLIRPLDQLSTLTVRRTAISVPLDFAGLSHYSMRLQSFEVAIYLPMPHYETFCRDYRRVIQLDTTGIDDFLRNAIRLTSLKMPYHIPEDILITFIVSNATILTTLHIVNPLTPQLCAAIARCHQLEDLVACVSDTDDAGLEMILSGCQQLASLCLNDDSQLVDTRRPNRLTKRFVTSMMAHQQQLKCFKFHLHGILRAREAAPKLVFEGALPMLRAHFPHLRMELMKPI